jgi:hypothetical protein
MIKSTENPENKKYPSQDGYFPDIKNRLSTLNYQSGYLPVITSGLSTG